MYNIRSILNKLSLIESRHSLPRELPTDGVSGEFDSDFYSVTGGDLEPVGDFQGQHRVSKTSDRTGNIAAQAQVILSRHVDHAERYPDEHGEESQILSKRWYELEFKEGPAKVDIEDIRLFLAIYHRLKPHDKERLQKMAEISKTAFQQAVDSLSSYL